MLQEQSKILEKETILDVVACKSVRSIRDLQVCRQPPPGLHWHRQLPIQIGDQFRDCLLNRSRVNVLYELVW